MYELGKKDEVLGSRDLNPITDIWQRPSNMPYVGRDEKVVCGYNQGLGERLFVCESVQDMQELYDKYAAGWALDIHWYRGRIAEIKIITLGPDAGIAGEIINRVAGNAPQEVKAALAAYAMGNPGAARVLAKRAKDFKTAKQVEELVGWPLSEHTFERSGNIWDRFRN